MEQQQKFDYAIVGGGVYGLSIAYHLAKSQHTVVLFQRYFYVLTKVHDWPYQWELAWSIESYQKYLLKEYQKFAKVAKSAKTKVEFMTSEQICKKFPSMPFIECSNTPIVDFDAAMIAADDYVSHLKQYLKTLPNIAIFENTQVKAINKNKQFVTIRTQSKAFSVQKVVVSAGRWVPELLPEVSDIAIPLKQYLAYCKLENPEQYQLGCVPSFIFISDKQHYYGTPHYKNMFGYKIGTHNARKDERQTSIVQKQAQENFVKMGKKLFKQKFKGISKYDQCYYTTTKTKQFLIDWVDPQEQILVCSCCSGHGFKFAPIIGKIISDLLRFNKSIDLFEKFRYSCQIPYHRGINLC